jgi:hypothetical protein
MKNRVRQFRTLGSVRGEDGAAMVNLHGHAAGNGGHGQGEPTVATGPLLLGAVQRSDDASKSDEHSARGWRVTCTGCGTTDYYEPGTPMVRITVSN